MSRTYYVMATVQGTTDTDTDIDAIDRIATELDMDPVSYASGDVEFSNSFILCGGMTEEEFAAHIRDTIWSRLGRYAQITVGWNYIEEFDDRVEYDEAAYAQWVSTHPITAAASS